MTNRQIFAIVAFVSILLIIAGCSSCGRSHTTVYSSPPAYYSQPGIIVPVPVGGVYFDDPVRRRDYYSGTPAVSIPTKPAPASETKPVAAAPKVDRGGFGDSSKPAPATTKSFGGSSFGGSKPVAPAPSSSKGFGGGSSFSRPSKSR